MYIRSSPRGPNRDPNRTLSNELLLIGPVRCVASKLAICYTIAILGGIPRRSINRIHCLRLSSYIAVRLRFNIIETRFSWIPLTRHYAVVLAILYILVAF